jgi:hypothetical protein
MSLHDMLKKSKEFSHDISDKTVKVLKTEDNSHKHYSIRDLIDWQLFNIRSGFATSNIPLESIEIEV